MTTMTTIMTTAATVPVAGPSSNLTDDYHVHHRDDEDDDEYLFDRTDVRATFIALYSVVFVACVVGNLLVIAVVSTSRRVRSRTNIFLVNLAVADLCVGLFCVYQNLSTYLAKSWVLGDLVCKLYIFVYNLSYTASVLVLVVVAAERYLAVLHPITCRAVLRPTRLKAVVACVWLAAAALNAPRLHWAQTQTVVVPHILEEVICIHNRNKYDQKVWDLATFSLLYMLPLFVMTVLYARIAAVLWGSGRGLVHRQQRQPNNTRRGVVKLTVTVVGVFALCHLPLHGRRLWQHWSPHYRGGSTFSALFTPATFLVAFANSAANPVLYALLSRNFRSGLRDVLARVVPKPCRRFRRFRRLLLLTPCSGGGGGAGHGDDAAGSSSSSDSSGGEGGGGRRRQQRRRGGGGGGGGGGSLLTHSAATAMTELPTLRDHSVATAMLKDDGHCNNGSAAPSAAAIARTSHHLLLMANPALEHEDET